MTASPRLVSGLVAFAILATACGSTVPLADGVRAPGPGQGASAAPLAGNGMGAPVGPGPRGATADTVPGSQDAPQDTARVAAPPQELATGDAAPRPVDRDPTPRSSAPAATDVRPAAPGALGITDEQIFIGFAYAENANAGNEAIGFEEITRGDARRYHELWIERVNAAGGIAGRELVPVFHVVDGASNESVSSTEERMCATWTQDNEVFTAHIAGATDVLRQCLANAGVGLISGQGLGVSDDRTFTDFPDTIEANNLSLDPMARVTVDGLAAQDYFTSDDPLEPVRLGIITYDYPTFRRVTKDDLLPALAAHGVEHEDPVYVKFPERQSDAGEVSAQLANTVVRFRSAGVTHVMIFEYNALLAALFLNSAEGQGYRPRYGFNSQNGGQLMMELVPPVQLRGAVSVGWLPLFDAIDAPQNAAARSCEKIYQDAGITFDSANARAIGMNFCDTYRLLQRGIEAAPGPLSRQSLTAGFERLGTSFESALVQSVRLGPDRHHGVSGYRHSAFDEGCECFHYTSGVHPIR